MNDVTTLILTFVYGLAVAVWYLHALHFAETVGETYSVHRWAAFYVTGPVITWCMWMWPEQTLRLVLAVLDAWVNS